MDVELLGMIVLVTEGGNSMADVMSLDYKV